MGGENLGVAEVVEHLHKGERREREKIEKADRLW